MAQFDSAQFGILGHSMARPDPAQLGTARPGTGWDAPRSPPCLLTLPDPGEIFQLASFHQFLCSPGPFSRRAAWLPGSRAHGEARADVLHGDRGTEPFCLWAHINLMHPGTHCLLWDGHKHPPGTTSRWAAGILHPLLFFRVELWMRCLGNHLLGGSGLGAASRWLLFGCRRLDIRPALYHWCQSL